MHEISRFQRIELCSTLCATLTLFAFFQAASAQAGPNVKVITPTAGDAVASCNSLVSVLNSTTGSSPSNRFLVKLEPGEYDCGSQSLQMREYVDLEGSGIETTHIFGHGSSPLFVAASHSGIRAMTVEVTGDPQADVIAIQATNTSPRITRMKIELDDAASCTAIKTTGAQSGPLATAYLRELEIKAKCEENNIGIDIEGKANPIIQRLYAKAVLGTAENVGIRVAMEGVSNPVTKEIRDVIVSAYGPSGNTDTATAIGLQFIPGPGADTEMNSFQLINSYIHAGNADMTRGIHLEGAADGSNLKPKLNVYNSQIISKIDYGTLVIGATLILHSSVVESGSQTGDAEIHATTQNGATPTKSTVRIGATHLREGAVSKDAGSTVFCESVYDKAFESVQCPN